MEDVPLRQYIEALMAEHEKAIIARLHSHDEVHQAEDRSIGIAREELNHWKAAHNEWQKRMGESVNREEHYRAHEELEKRLVEIHNAESSKIDGLSRLVYIGLGFALIIPVLIQVLAVIMRK